MMGTMGAAAVGAVAGGMAGSALANATAPSEKEKKQSLIIRHQKKKSGRSLFAGFIGSRCIAKRPCCAERCRCGMAKLPGAGV